MSIAFPALALTGLLAPAAVAETLVVEADGVALPGHVLLPGLMDDHVHLNYIIDEGWETEPARFVMKGGVVFKSPR